MFFILQVFTNISGLVLLDIEGNIESCNPHFVKILFGQSEMDLKGKVSYPLIFPTDYVSYSNIHMYKRRILFNNWGVCLS